MVTERMESHESRADREERAYEQGNEEMSVHGFSSTLQYQTEHDSKAMARDDYISHNGYFSKATKCKVCCRTARKDGYCLAHHHGLEKEFDIG